MSGLLAGRYGWMTVTGGVLLLFQGLLDLAIQAAAADWNLAQIPQPEASGAFAKITAGWTALGIRRAISRKQ